MTIYFITGNQHKFSEASAIVPSLERLDIDLPELQEIDPHKIIEAKLQAAFEHYTGPFVVEDTSFYLDCLNGLPGPLIKWFIKSLGSAGVYDLAHRYENTSAKAVTVIGYAQDRDNVQFFEGVVSGQVVEPRGDNGFGFDPIFMPHGYNKTQAEMTAAEKNQFSSRKLAFEQLAQVL